MVFWGWFLGPGIGRMKRTGTDQGINQSAANNRVVDTAVFYCLPRFCIYGVVESERRKKSEPAGVDREFTKSNYDVAM